MWIRSIKRTRHWSFSFLPNGKFNITIKSHLQENKCNKVKTWLKISSYSRSMFLRSVENNGDASKTLSIFFISLFYEHLWTQIKLRTHWHAWSHVYGGGGGVEITPIINILHIWKIKRLSGIKPREMSMWVDLSGAAVGQKVKGQDCWLPHWLSTGRRRSSSTCLATSMVSSRSKSPSASNIESLL